MQSTIILTPRWRRDMVSGIALAILMALAALTGIL